jgi:hypothetical protein
LRFDATLKELITPQPAEFAVAFGVATAKPVAALNVDLSTLSAATDVALGVGDPLEEVVDLNFQSGPDPGLPSRVHIYNAVLNARYEVPVRSLVVLLRRKADAANLTGKLSYGGGDTRVEFNYRVVRFWEQPIEPFLKGGLSVLPFAMLCHMPDDRSLAEVLREVVVEIYRRLKAETSEAQCNRFMTATFLLAGLRVQKQELSGIFRGVGNMQDSAAYDVMVEEGAIRQARRTALRLGTRRFGTPSPQSEQELNSIDNLERLDRITDAIPTAQSWHELLATE